MNLHDHERFLWGLCYRMTGSAADADDLVQETFARALERPPRDVAAPLRPWLTRVAVNLARDTLRRRRRTPYVGTWLPTPLETEGEETVAVEPPVSEGRYELLESVSFAFLVALEALNPKQRAVLLLRDVFDYSVREVADALGATEDNVKQLHLRARRAMAEYDAARVVPTRELQARNRAALDGFVEALLSNDAARVEAVLAKSVKAMTDGGGRYHAAVNAIIGAEKVARFMLGINSKRGAPIDGGIMTLNGLPAIVLRYDPTLDPRLAPLVTFSVDVDAEGKISAIHSVLAPQKLVAFPRRAA
ncbi:MAG: sigma-70 family RNA polymerase sigma factor [Myxococcaceae bacterium]|nr:sigma-70 family RNA polymerase sigma factor [Myxococcaceae bacterium]